MSGAQLISMPVGGAQSNSAVYPIDPRTFTAAGALAANTGYLLKFRVAREITVSKIKLRCVSAAGGGNVDVAIHTSDGTTWTKVAGPSAVAAVSAAVMTFTLTAAYTLVPFTDYWVSMSCSEATSTFVRISVVAADIGGLDNLCILRGTEHPFNASFTGPSNSNIAPFLWLEV